MAHLKRPLRIELRIAAHRSPITAPIVTDTARQAGGSPFLQARRHALILPAPGEQICSEEDS
jgi:hypothetical protein